MTAQSSICMICCQPNCPLTQGRPHQPYPVYTSLQNGALPHPHLHLQTVTSLVWRPLKAHRVRGLWDVGHHWLGRLAWLFAIAAMFTGIYIAAVGWGYHVAFAAAIVAFVLAMAFKDLVDICMVCLSLRHDVLFVNYKFRLAFFDAAGCG